MAISIEPLQPLKELDSCSVRATQYSAPERKVTQHDSRMSFCWSAGKHPWQSKHSAASRRHLKAWPACTSSFCSTLACTLLIPWAVLWNLMIVLCRAWRSNASPGQLGRACIKEAARPVPWSFNHPCSITSATRRAARPLTW